MSEYIFHFIRLDHPEQVEALSSFLRKNGLRLENDIDAAVGCFDETGQIAACGCASGSLLKCFAVEVSLRGKNVLGELIVRLGQERFSRGIYDLFVITRLHNEPLFAGCGFYPVVRTETLIMLENQPNGPERYLRSLSYPHDIHGVIGSVIMNCNPFTKGHRALIEYASAHCDVLHIFVVEEDRSFFSAKDRYQMVKDGVADLPNAFVHMSGHYIISAVTFPTYFLKSYENASLLQAELDILLFSSRIAPALGISRRFVGQEPLDPLTAQYNSIMKCVLPQNGIELIEIPRIVQNNQVISASLVRSLLQKEGVTQRLLSLVPESTQQYLIARAR